MSRDLIIVTHCDNRDVHDGRRDIPAEQHTITVDGKPLEVDLCPSCESVMLAPLLALARDELAIAKRRAPRTQEANAPKKPKDPPESKPAKAKRAKPEATSQCPLCPRGFVEGWVAEAHMKNIHSVPLKKLWDDTCPLCGKFMGADKLGHHTRATHKIRGGRPMLYSHALAAGDPYGIVAQSFQRANIPMPSEPWHTKTQ